MATSPMTKPIQFILLAWLLLIAQRHSLAETPSSPHPVVAKLIDEGFDIDEGVTVLLAPPVVNPEMTADEQRGALKKLFGSRMSLYMRDRIVAPQLIRVKTERKLGKKGTIRRLDQYFVVYGDLSMIRDKELMDNFMAKEKQQTEEAEPEPFEQILEPQHELPEGEEIDTTKPYVYRYSFPILEKVVISGLIRSQSKSTDELLIESSISAPDLLDDPNDPTVWRKIPRGAKNAAALGPPEPFRGLAGYLQVTPLKFQSGALLVECHGALVEPTGWFDGKNLLASKLPLVGQENVRTFRRKIKKVQAEQAQRQTAAE